VTTRGESRRAVARGAAEGPFQIEPWARGAGGRVVDREKCSFRRWIGMHMKVRELPWPGIKTH
jgi:hypothetical protein